MGEFSEMVARSVVRFPVHAPRQSPPAGRVRVWAVPGTRKWTCMRAAYMGNARFLQRGRLVGLAGFGRVWRVKGGRHDGGRVTAGIEDEVVRFNARFAALRFHTSSGVWLNGQLRELSGASIPFPFDVHMMISCDNAPTLENTIHRELHLHRVNRIRPKKEFFRIDLKTIRRIVEENHGTVDYVADPEALKYNQSLHMTDEDQEFINQVYENIQAYEDEFGDEVDDEIE